VMREPTFRKRKGKTGKIRLEGQKGL
jgi:hypothetical protein